VHLGFDFKKTKTFNKLDKNILYIKKIVKLANQFKFKIIFPSTSTYKYKKNKKEYKSNKIYSFNNYSLSKINCENYLRQSSDKGKKDITILRIFNVYGPYQKKGWLIPDLTHKFLEKKFTSLKLKYYNNTRDFIYIEDVCSAICKSFKLKGLNILDIGSTRDTKIHKIARIIALILKSKKKIFLLEKKSKINSVSKANIKNTVKILGWKPKVKLLDGLTKTMKYEKKRIKNFNFL
jgi:UDP-glucose 4-epimerase